MTEVVLSGLMPHHVGISVRNLDEAIGFWVETFGFALEMRTDLKGIGARVAFLNRDGFRLELFEKQGAVAASRDRLRPNSDLMTHGTKHLAFSVDDAQAALEELHSRGVRIVGVLRGKGLPMEEEEDPLGDRSRPPALALFFLDASDTLVEIVQRSEFTD